MAPPDPGESVTADQAGLAIAADGGGVIADRYQRTTVLIVSSPGIRRYWLPFDDLADLVGRPAWMLMPGCGGNTGEWDWMFGAAGAGGAWVVVLATSWMADVRFRVQRW
jgi:hypothetical protein